MDVRTQFLTITVSVTIPVSGMNVNDLEERWVEAGRKGMARSIREMQEGFQRAHRSRLERREWRRRWIQTRLGPVRVEMLKVRAVETGQNVVLGRDLLEMAPRQRATPWVERRAVELRVRGLSYRQAATALGDFTSNAGIAHVVMASRPSARTPAMRTGDRGAAKRRATDERPAATSVFRG